MSQLLYVILAVTWAVITGLGYLAMRETVRATR